jgi:heat-inducible transcriptional repressor
VKGMDRRFQILDLIVDEYIRTGIPIGSNAIKALLPYPVSSATVRAEMAALENDGYLDHPHTSAGRVPTVKGYRRYIERMSGADNKSPPPGEDMRQYDEMFESLRNESDEVVIETASHALAEVTKCAVVTSNAAARFSVITKVEVIPTGRRMYVLLLITQSGDIRNRVCRLQFDLTQEQMSFFTKFVSDNLEGMAADNISEALFGELAAALGNYMMTLSPLLKAVEDISNEMRAKRIRFEGEHNLIANESLDKNQLVALLEQRSEFTELLDSAFSGVNVMFGKEKDGESTFVVQNSSLITGGFSKSGKPAGSFGVIGPIRLDYKRIIPYLEYFTAKVTGILTGNNGGDQIDEENNVTIKEDNNLE